MSSGTTPFVGTWQCFRYRADLQAIEEFQLTVTLEAGDVLDGHYHVPGHDITLNGSVTDGRLWVGTAQSADPSHTGQFALLLSADARTFGGSWSGPQLPAPTAWIGSLQ